LQWKKKKNKNEYYSEIVNNTPCTQMYIHMAQWLAATKATRAENLGIIE